MKNNFTKSLVALVILIGSMRTVMAQAEGLIVSPTTDTLCIGEEISVTYTGADIEYLEYWYQLDSVNWQWTSIDYSTQWYGLGGFPYSHPNSPANFYVPAVPPGWYFIELWDTDFVYGGGESVEAYSDNLYIAPRVTAAITPSGPTTFCGGGSVVLDNGGSTGKYQWFLNGDTLVGDTDSYFVAEQAGNYTLAITNVCGTYTSSAVTVTIDSVPVAAISANGPATFCPGDSVILSTTTANAYQWSNNATTQSITVKQSGDYSVSVDNGGNCSAVSSDTIVTVYPAPGASISPGGNIAFCAGDSAVLTVQAQSSYLWSTGASTQNITVNIGGSYTVMVTDTLGCTAISGATLVTVNQPPSATSTPSANTTFCAGDSVTLTANAESSYLWSSGATAQAVTVATAGNYTVTVTDTNGCTAASIPTVVTVNILPQATITPNGPFTFCQGDSVILSANTESSYLWAPGSATGQSITVEQNGSYTVQVTDANGCLSTSAPFTVTVDTLPDAAVTVSGDTVFCAGGSVILSAGTATIYAWNNSATSSNITITQSGTYSVTITNSDNCSASSSGISVTVNAIPDISIIPASVSFCVGGNATLTASGGISFAWSDGGNVSTTIVTPDSTTTYMVTVTNAEGCSDTAGRTVTVNPLPSATISPSGPVEICQGDSAALSAPVGNPGYLWSNNATTQTIYAGFTGNYQVTVTSVNNCSAVSNAVAVTVNPLPAAPVITQAGTTLTSTAAASYQWYLDGSLLNGDTLKQFNITQNGQYQVEITDSNGCQNISAIFNATGAGIGQIASVYDVKLYPNPNNGNFTLEFTDNAVRDIEITDAIGRTIVSSTKVEKQKNFNLNDIASGVYILRIIENNEAKSLKFSIMR